MLQIVASLIDNAGVVIYDPAKASIINYDRNVSCCTIILSLRK
jgi:hypothetical protein